MATQAGIECSESGCKGEPVHILRRQVYCAVHVPDTWKAWHLHLIGLICWAAAWATIFFGVSRGWFPDEILINAHDKWFFLIPAGIGAFVFVANIFLSLSSGRFTNYQTEVQVIEFVERNASWFLVASGTFLGGGSFYFNFLHRADGALPASRSLGESAPFVSAFILFISLSVFCLLPVVSLYWVPYQESPYKLVILRHLKTIPFAFGLGFFAAAMLALLLSIGTLP